MVIEEHHSGNDAQYIHKNPSQPGHHLSMCSVPHSGCVAGSPLFSGLLQENVLELSTFCVSQPLCFLCLQEPGSSRKSLLGCFGPAPAGVSSLFWKGLFHMRTLTLQPSIPCTLVLGRFCGSAGCTWILLKDLAL